MSALFIAGAGTDVGKTYVTAALLRDLRAQGRAVDALKPVVSGFDEAAPAGSDPAILLDALGSALTAAALDRIAPWRYRAPLAPNQAAAREGKRVDGAAVIELCRERIQASLGQLLVIESAGGIMSPLDDRLTMLDLAIALGAPVLLVAGSYLGAISHALTAASVIRSTPLDLAAVVLSETAREPAIADTLSALRARLPSTPVFAIGRHHPAPSTLLGLVENLPRVACLEAGQAHASGRGRSQESLTTQVQTGIAHER